ncbi:MAG: glycoside hydrolase family 9 protein, partial [Ruminococcus sp.]|nr:glycoside hydrolase family 9 protein [Ruminococcus sp.]
MQFKLNKNKIKSVLLSGAMAVSSLAAPFSASVAPAINASAATSDNYARLLQYSLYFYDANMCGTDVNSKCAMTWRSNCHTDDEVPGGFHDAGDHAMFGLPQGYTAATLGWAYYEFSDAFNETGQADHLKTITDYFCDFFKRSTKLNGNTVSNFLYQKGDGQKDHGYWGPPEMQGGGRQMFWTSNSASDIAAEYAAALAANYVNFGNSEDLKYAEALYKFSTQYNSVATYGPSGFYNSNGCADEQAWAAGWLYLATKNQSYLNDLRGKLPKVGWVHGWNDAHLGANCLYGEITGDWSGANGYISGKAQGSNYMFLDKWGSARINCSMQMTALIATKHQAGNYKDWAKGQMNYILGSNPANTCFVTEFASNSAKNAHHRGASGYTSYEQFNMNGWDPDGDHMQPYCQFGGNAHPLVGALVGGPCDAGGTCHDNMADYICNEVAIDYNAGLVGAAAGLYHFYKTGTCDSSINGVKNVSTGPSTTTSTTTTSTTTTTTTSNPRVTTTTTTTTTTNPPSSNGKYTINVGDSYNCTNLKEMIGFAYSDFGLTANSPEKITKVEVKISSKNGGNLGKWQGAFGSSTTVAADGYWTQSEDMEQQFSSNSGTITWNVPTATANIIQYGYGGELKFGVWWVDCQDFVIDSVTLYTTGSAVTTTTTTTTTTTKTTTTTT